MTTNRYTAAGWAAILSAAGTLCVLGLSFVFDFSSYLERRGGPPEIGWSPTQVGLVAGVDAIGTLLGIYALLRFRSLLQERYDFHAIDHLIWVVIGAGLLVGAVSYSFKLVGGSLGAMLVGVASMGVLGVLNGVIGLVFGARLLRINGNLNGYKKPLAYTYLAGSVCFLFVVPALVGVVLLSVWSILLGLAFFRGEEMEELEVV